MSVKGLPQLLNRLKKFDANVQKEVKEEIFYAGQVIAAEATRNAPLSIVVHSDPTNNGFGSAIYANAGKIAAYVEFGTGMSAAEYVPSLPQEWQALAKSFYVNGEGTLRKQPYLYPAYSKQVPVLVKNLRLILKREAKK